MKRKKFFVIYLLSVFFGFSTGIFCYSFWLSQILPPLSLRVFGLTFAITLVGTAAGYFFIHRIIFPGWEQMKKKDLIRGAALSLLLTLIVMWFGFQGFMPKVGYLTFLLPDQALEISVDHESDAGSSETRLTWFNTSLGEISFNSLEYNGWERVGDVLELRVPGDNQITWLGKTGREATLNFESETGKGELNISWNGKTRHFNFAPLYSGETITNKTFDVPVYASPWVSVLFGSFSLVLMIFGGYCYYWMSREKAAQYFAQIKQQISSNHWEQIDYLLILVFIIFAFILRAVNLEALYPLADEYSHLLAAKSILSGSPINSVYSRSLYIVTLPVAFFLKVFGQHLWAARLAGVTFNTLAIIPLFIISRKVNRSFAITSSLIYATSPWIISVARNVREYGYYPFYFYLVLLLLMVFWEKFPERFVFRRDWRDLIKPVSLLTYLVSAFILYYAKYIDPASTFRTILPVFLVTTVFLLIKVDWKNKSNLIFALIVSAIFLFSLSLFFKRFRPAPNFLTNLSLVKELFAQNSPVSWFYERSTVITGLAVFAAVALAVKLHGKRLLSFFLISLFFISVALFSVVFNHYIRSRYFFNLQIWFVLLLSFGLYGLWVFGGIFLRMIFSKFLKTSTGRNWPANVISAGLIIACINFDQVTLPIRYSQNGFMPITTEYHYDMSPVQDIVLNQQKNEEVLIYNIYGSYVRWVGKPKFKKYFYTSDNKKNQQEYIFSIIDRYPHGWIVLDQWHGEAYSKPLEFSDFSLGTKHVEYKGKFVDEHVWKW